MTEYFLFTPITVRDNSIDRGAVVTALRVDRKPTGPLGSRIARARSTAVTDACGSCTNATDVSVVKMFTALKGVYDNDQCYSYGEERHLPGFITWAVDNGYTLVDLKHVNPHGIWLRYG